MHVTCYMHVHVHVHVGGRLQPYSVGLQPGDADK
jgi:hypothetical protein